MKEEPFKSDRPYRVLVVEDNDEVRRFSTGLLEDLGYVVKPASGATEALDLLAEDEFAIDLVFSDVVMPGMDGLELATLIRQRFPGLPVVLTSGYSRVLPQHRTRWLRAYSETLLRRSTVTNFAKDPDDQGLLRPITAALNYQPLEPSLRDVNIDGVRRPRPGVRAVQMPSGRGLIGGVMGHAPLNRPA